MIQINGLTFGYAGQDNIFDHVTVALDERWKTGLIGRNGRGKTTLLKLLDGALDGYKGSIAVPIPTVRFSVDEANGKTAFEAAARYGGEEWEIVREADLLGVADLLYRPLKSLSGGQKTRVQLAGMFAVDAFRLIDEPTDSLDLRGRAAVARYLAGKRGFILASHDRAFLDACIDHVLAVTRSGVTLTAGTCSSYLNDVDARERNERIENERLRREIDRLDRAADARHEHAIKAERSKFGVQASGLKADRGAVGHKAAKMMKAATVLEKRIERAAEEKRALLRDAETEIDIRLYPLSFRSQTLVNGRITAAYGAHTVLDDIAVRVERGARLAVVGGNGCGKSTLLKSLVGVGDATVTGSLRRPSDLVVSYVPQEPMFDRPLQRQCEAVGADPSVVTALLVQLGMRPELRATDFSRMSLGERKKAALALSLSTRAHVYVWDEPLNYVDMPSRRQIERLIVTFRPTLVFVEHDAAFVERVATGSIRLD